MRILQSLCVLLLLLALAGCDDKAQEVYVDVARADYGIDGRPTNNSRVAMLTGLSRREVARVRDMLLDAATYRMQPG